MDDRFRTFPKDCEQVAKQYVDGAITAFELMAYVTNMLEVLELHQAQAKYDNS